MATLSLTTTETGIEFTLMDGRRNLSIEEWGQHAVETGIGPGSVGPLLARLEDEIAKVSDDKILLPHEEVAKLDDEECRQLGLPDPAPYRIELRSQGLLSSPGFDLKALFSTHDGRPLMGVKRQGSVLTVGKQAYLLLDPLFSLVEGVDRFRATPPGDMDERFARWAELRLLLPEDAVVDDQLKNMNIVRPDSFTLNVRGDDQFDPVLLTRASHGEEGPGEEPAYSAVLPESHHETFARRFSDLDSARQHYALGGGWYVLVPDHLRRALETVRKAQELPPAERRAFIANPHAALREEFGDELDEGKVEDLFNETPEFLSERVRAIGEWVPKANVYMMPRENQWLPAEEMEFSIPVGTSLVKVKGRDLPEMLDAMESALAAGVREIEFEGHRVPVSPETVEAVSGLVVRKAEGEAPDPGEAVLRSVLAPILIDNIEDVGYQASPRQRAGVAGGIPAGLKTTSLYKHQKEGLRWLQEHWVSGGPGALLADDMGLGKTLQTLAFLAWHREHVAASHGSKKPYLIVAPTGLLKNWEDEADIHLMPGTLGNLLKAYGKDLRDLSSHGSAQRFKRFQEAEWVLTTYETLRDKITYFMPIDWAIVAFDEAQKIKNPAARLTESAKSLKSDFTLLLTGTPVENRLADLWCIVDAAAPGFLGSMKEFHSQYEADAEENPEVASALRDKLQHQGEPPLMLRRLKEDHLDGLPDKKSKVIRLKMPPAQAQAYDQALARAVQAKGTRGAMLEVLHGLRMNSLLAGNLGPEGLTDEAVDSSARLKGMISVLDEISERGEKALVFLESLKLQEALIPYLQRRYDLSKPPLRISGQVGGGLRKARVDEFQKGEQGRFDVMLLSPKAGGVGLTLTAANHVIHLSRWWNPAVEDQCTDRVYRIGQTRPVTVYYPMAEHPALGDGSFDIRLHELLEEKRRLSRSALSAPVMGSAEFESFFNSVVYD